MYKFDFIHKFDLVQLIGQKSCSLATSLTEFVTSEPACAKAEVWNMGLLVTITATLVLAVWIIRERRRLRREDREW